LLKRGNLPCCFLYYSRSLCSADSDSRVFRKRKCVALTMSLRFVCKTNLDRIDLPLSPIYTTSPFDLYPISYTPEVLGASLTWSKLYQSALIGIAHLPTILCSVYTNLVIDSNTPSVLTLAKKLRGAIWTGIPSLNLGGSLQCH
jgi:hypothetical protein